LSISVEYLPVSSEKQRSDLPVLIFITLLFLVFYKFKVEIGALNWKETGAD